MAEISQMDRDKIGFGLLAGGVVSAGYVGFPYSSCARGEECDREEGVSFPSSPRLAISFTFSLLSLSLLCCLCSALLQCGRRVRPIYQLSPRPAPQFFYFAVTEVLPSTVAFGIVSCSPLVALLVDTVVFQVFAGSTYGIWAMVLLS